MSTAGQFSTKNPTIKRILKEASELQNQPSSDYTAAPLESNLFEWHFTLRGPPEPSPFAGGTYHGRIVLPPAYPLRPPSFRFLTPSGRFEVNREICLSISGFHEETWQPAWGIRTALVAIRSFMDSEAAGQVGGMSSGSEVRKKFARESGVFRCAACAKTNAEIMAEVEERVKEEGVEKSEEKVPDELKLGYRDQLGQNKSEQANESTGEQTAVPNETGGTSAQRDPAPPTARVAQPVAPTQSTTQPDTPVARTTTAVIPPAASTDTSLIDKAIIGVVVALAYLIWKVMMA